MRHNETTTLVDPRTEKDAVVDPVDGGASSLQVTHLSGGGCRASHRRGK